MNSLLRKTLVLAIALWSSFLSAEDIDLFVGVPAGVDSELPNVLIVVDNTANWGSGKNPQPFTNLRAAIAAVIETLPIDQFRIGIMLYNETGNPNNNVAGGYVRAAVRTMDETSKSAYANMVKSLDPVSDRGNGAIGSLVMAEAWRYFDGGDAYAGNFKQKTDYTGNTSGTAADRAVYKLAENALSSKNAQTYNTPVAEGSCAGNYIIYISNGPSTDNTAVKKQSRGMLVQAGGAAAATEISLNPSGLQDNPIDEWSRFMRQSDLGVTTYTVEINPGVTGQAPAWTAVLKSMSAQGEGKYFPVSTGGSDSQAAKDIAAAVLEALSEIQSVNSVFASVSLPVSVNTQGTYLNQVFVGMFRPVIEPRWYGNLKQYKLGYADGRLRLLDADEQRAISSAGTGFVAECARSFWTPLKADANSNLYWENIKEANCLGFPAASDTPDGNLVEKGGHSILLRKMAPTNRKVLTCDASCNPELVDFDSSSVSAAKLGVPASDAGALIDWARGLNVNEPVEPISGKTGAALSSSMRPSVHGDVVHSRPVAINYADSDDEPPQVVVFYGGNDGMLRAINGNRDGGATFAGTEPGEEIWSFVAPESYSMLNRIKENTPSIKFPGMPFLPDTPEPEPKTYGFDGGIVAHQEGGKVWLYGSMRRGGNSIYAFDVTDPASPELMWRAAPDIDGFSNIGQTWGAPTIVKAASAPSKPLLLVGGGYDICEDEDPADCAAVTKGRQIYLIDAESGKRLQAFATSGRVVGDVTAVRYPTGTPNAGLLKYAYASDLSGNVYRISGAFDSVKGYLPIDSTSPGSWVITQITSLGGAGVDARKFLFAPDVIQEGGTISLLLGTGDREKPVAHYTNATAVQNYFYRIDDVPSDICWPNFAVNGACEAGKPEKIVQDSLVTIDPNIFAESASLDDDDRLAIEQTAKALAGARGWKLPLVAPGEKAVTSPLTIFGKIYFSTHQPSFPQPGQCSNNLGTARAYAVGFDKPFFSSAEIPGGGLPPSPVAGLVTLDDGTTVPFCIGCDPDSPLEGAEPPPPEIANQPKARVFWNIENLE